MLQDQGPGYLGRYGLVNNPFDNPNKEDYDSGGDPSAGFLGKKLNGHPVMRFMVMAAGTAVGMAVAGKVVKEGGLRLADKLAEGGFRRLTPMFGEGWQHELLHSARRVQRVFDGWEGGVHRLIEDDLNFRELPNQTKRRGVSFWSTFHERQRIAQRQAQGFDLDVPLPEWHFRDSMRQSMVRSIRRLPYEIPAAYVTQRFILDPMLGRDPEDRRPNWYNPIDVLGDFAQQSAKNLAFFITPIDVLPQAMRDQYHALISAQADVAPSLRRVKLDHLLKLVGHDVGKTAVGSARLGQKTLGSFAAGIHESMQSSKSPMQVVRDLRTRSQRNLSRQQFFRETLRDLGNIEFGGTGGLIGFGKGFAKRWDEFNELYAMSDAARTPGFNPALSVSLPPKLTPRSVRDYGYNVARRLAGLPERPRAIEVPFDPAKAYIPGGNYSRIEQYAHALETSWYGHGGYRSGAVYAGQMNQQYRGILKKHLLELMGPDVDRATVDKVFELLEFPKLPGKRAEEKVTAAMRVKFGDQRMVGDTWHGEFRSRIAGIKGVQRGTTDAITQNIEEAVKRSELYFAQNFRQIEKTVKGQWNALYYDAFLPEARQSLGNVKPTLAEVSSNTEDANRFLRRKTAEKLTVNPWNARDARGRIIPSPITANTPDSEIVKRLRFWGFDPDDMSSMRAFLQDEGEIRFTDKNIFGFSPLSIGEALQRNYFTGEKTVRNVEALQRQIQNQDPTQSILGKRIPVGKGVWTLDLNDASRKIVDLTGYTRGAQKFLDTLSVNFQLPLLGINPLRTLFYEAERQARSDVPIVSYMRGGGNFPFLPDDVKDASAFMWFRNRGSHGRIAALMTDTVEGAAGTTSRSRIEWLKGTYRISRTDADSMAGRNLRMAIGDKGLIPEKERGRVSRFFAIDQDQRDSIFSLTKRFRQRKTDLTNPFVFSRFLLDNEKILSGKDSGVLDEALERFARSRLTQEELAAGVVPDMAKVRAEFLEGWNEWTQRTQMNPLSEQISRGLGGTLDSPLGRILSREYSDPQQVYAHAAEFVGHQGSARREFFTSVIENIEGRPITQADYEEMVLNRDGKYNPFYRIYQRFEGVVHNQMRLIPSGGTVPYFENPANEAFEAAGMHRRLDIFKRDLTKSEFFRETLGRLMGEAGNTNSPQIDVITELLQGLDRLGREANIPVAQLNQYRTVILSFQTDFLEAQARNSKSSIMRIREEQIRGLLNNTSTRQIISDFEQGMNIDNPVLRRAKRRFGMGKYRFPGVTYNPFGNDRTFVPSFSNVFSNRSKMSAVSSVLGLNTWSNPKGFSQAAVPMSHFMTRLNKVFETFNLGIDETQFKGPLDYYARGLVGKRIFPFVAGSAVIMGADRTLGGTFGPRDQDGNRVYRPFLTAPLFRGAVEVEALSALAPGGESYQSRREQLLRGEVPIRKGRFWPLGNTPFRGGRTQYYRPSWYRRMMSGSQYTGQLYDSPVERLAFGYDFSPLRPFDPYRFERKHYEDRPYPVSGEYFTGPWGPLTTALNMTVGKVLKPTRQMHKQEMQAAMLAYNPVGQAAAAPPVQTDSGQGVFYSTSGGRSGIAVPRYAGDILNQQIVYGNMLTGVVSGKGQTGTGPNAVAMSGGSYGKTKRRMQYAEAQTISTVVTGTKGTGIRTRGSGGAASPTMGGGYGIQSVSQVPVSPTAEYLNQAYSRRSQEPRVGGSHRLDQQMIMTSGSPMSPRLIPRTPTIPSNSLRVQASQAGYEFQELFGIYGFLFGSARESLGFGNQDFSPKRPVLTSAARAYGSERSFWDLNLGGLGDTPIPLDSQYANLEISEIARRFISHRRRDITEVNPIPNKMGKEYPWLPGSDYFINFRQGDPYTLVPEGEIRLPGRAYERLNKLHPDATGRYGLVDQLKILGNVAPWSQQYRALLKTVSNMNLSPEQQSIVSQTRKQVAAMNKEHEFSPYQWKNQNFETKSGKVIGTVPGAPNLFMTDVFGDRPVRLAGVRVGQDAADQLAKYVSAGDKVSLTYDANQSPIYARTPEQPIDVIMKVNGQNINETLKDQGLADPSRSNQPIDKYVKTSAPMRMLNQGVEHFLHLNTLVNTKFLPYRTPVEDWERNNVYGASFPQWQNPIQDYLKPMIYRATTRNPITSAIVLGGTGRLFMKGAYAKRVASTVGAAVGFGAGLVRTEQSIQTGQRFIPKERKRELAVEEYADILNYVKYSRLYNESRTEAVRTERTDPEQILTAATRQAEKTNRSYWKIWNRSPVGAKPATPESTKIYRNVGPITQQALMYRKKMKQTLYGADLNGDLMDTYMAIPKRKREHFMEFINAPKRDRSRILSTAGRLERRVYESRWGMKIERRPDLDDYFKLHELPDENWEGWRPDVSMDQVKIKIGQNLGLEMSNMGYYPQQIQEANLVNPSYPQFDRRSSHQDVVARLERLMAAQGINGSVNAVSTSFAGNRIRMNAGVL